MRWWTLANLIVIIISQDVYIIMLYISDLHSDVYRLYLSKAEQERMEEKKETNKDGLHSQPKYWLRTSVLVHPQRLQPNSGAVSLVSRWNCNTNGAECLVAADKPVNRVSGSPGKHESARPWHPWHWGSRGNLTSSRSQHRASSKPCRCGRQGV